MVVDELESQNNSILVFIILFYLINVAYCI